MSLCFSIRDAITEFLAGAPEPADRTVPTHDCTPVFQLAWPSGVVRMLSDPPPARAVIAMDVLDDVESDPFTNSLHFDGERLSMPGRTPGERVRYRPVFVDDARRLLVCDLAEIVTVGDDPTPPVPDGGLPVEWSTR